jgi:ATP-dependent Clp protease adaptor protein ClpS
VRPFTFYVLFLGCDALSFLVESPRTLVLDAIVDINQKSMSIAVDIALPKTTTDVEYVIVSDEELERPYRVIIQNDDVTPMDFVVLVLLTIFGLDIERAFEVMLAAHTNGRALVATLPFEEAQQRVYEAQSQAREAGYPLSFYLEPDS